MMPPSSESNNRELLTKEIERMKRRFSDRTEALGLFRLTLIISIMISVMVPRWRVLIESALPHAAVFSGTLLITGLATHFLKNDAKYGRLLVFLGMVLDLTALVPLLSTLGGLSSGFTGVVILYSILFALLFPNPVSILPPLSVLPATVVMSRLIHHTSLNKYADAYYMLWWALMAGTGLYIIVFLTAREEKQSRDILKLQVALKSMAVVNERNRLSRDIHDGLGGALSGLIIQIEFLQNLVKKHKDEMLNDELVELKSASEEAIDEVRRALTMMRDEFQLVPQLEKMCQNYINRNKLPIELKIEGEPAEYLSDEQKLTMFRIIQECLTNITKHAQAKCVNVNVDFGPETSQIEIIDDGVGFDMGDTPEHHYGLVNMRERAEKIAGHFDMKSTVGEGTYVSLKISRLKAGQDTAGFY